APVAAASTPSPSHAALPTTKPQEGRPVAAPRTAPTPAPARRTDASWWNPPASGVYTYNTTGYEKATFSRNYPPQTQRIIDTSNGRYGNHHIFSQEHEEWFTLA